MLFAPKSRPLVSLQCLFLLEMSLLFFSKNLVLSAEQVLQTLEKTSDVDGKLH